MSGRAILDSCVLVPYNLASLLLTLAERGVFEARWSESILEETHRALTTKLGLEAERATRRCDAMRAGFPESAVADFRRYMADLECDPKDRHVLAAAIASDSDVIVTFNLKHFPETACRPFGVIAVHPDDFLLGLLGEDPDAVVTAVAADAARRSQPVVGTVDLLARLARTVPTFANSAQQVLPVNGPASDLPAYVAADVADSPLGSLSEADLEDPLHVAALWWLALLDQERFGEQLRWLTHDPRAWGDYRWAFDLLATKSIASKVYYAVDDPDNVAVVRFVPEVAATAQVLATFMVSGMVFLTLCRQPDGTWRAWGLGPRMVSAHTVMRE